MIAKYIFFWRVRIESFVFHTHLGFTTFIEDLLYITHKKTNISRELILAHLTARNKAYFAQEHSRP